MDAVFSLLPRAGLGNKLLVWGRGAAFAEINGLPHYTLGWTHLSLGSILRPGRRRPFYGKSFDSGISPALHAWRLLGPVTVEPELGPGPPATYVFNAIPHWRDYFAGLREQRTALRRRFFSVYRGNVPPPMPPFVALHVRRGDFRETDSRPFAEQGLTRTPLVYFRDIACQLRDAIGRPVPIRLFSDGLDSELADLLSLPDCTRYLGASDAEELVAMSQAGAVVASASSTFPLWAGFLGDGVLIHHPDHFHQPVRPAAEAWEGPWPGTPAPLLTSLRRIF